jgi:hypothetical protein
LPELKSAGLATTRSRPSQKERFNIFCTSSGPKPPAYVLGLGGGVSHLDRGDPGGRGADPQPVDEDTDRRLIAARQHLDATVGKIARMTVYPELTGAARSGSAIKNPLNPAAYQTLLANHARA